MKKAIIVADDSVIIVNIIKKVLSSEFEILVAQNGKEAIDIVKNNSKYEIIGMLLDLNMPSYDGFVTLDYFKHNNLFSKIPVSIISGDDSKETIDRAFTYNIVDMLNKPFSSDNIKNIVNKLENFKNV